MSGFDPKVMSEHPNPIFSRSEWQSLNGKWEYEEDNSLSGAEQHFETRDRFSKEILVPFCPESKLSGIENTDFINAVWYKRSFTVPYEKKGSRTILHFGAVDYRTKVWINGHVAGSHFGGYSPFSFDITDFVSHGDSNVIVVYVQDDTRSRLQPTGKQCKQLGNRGCMYTRTTGIWQSVWLEYVPEIYITDIKLTPDTDNEWVEVQVEINKPYHGKIKAAVMYENEPVTETGVIIGGKSVSFTIQIKNPVLWSFDRPALYDLTLKVAGDCVYSYFGMRKVSLEGKVFKLNNRTVFQRLVLDQGYYPDGVYTAPTDEDLKNDILLSKQLGFNGARMHMKVFDPRYIYWADRLGYMVWGEYPNWGLDVTNPASLNVMLPEWMEVLKRDYNHPSIIGWCPFNETNSERRPEVLGAVVSATRLYDAYRPIIDVSGYTHTDITDIYDVHDYCQDVDEFASHYEKLAEGIAWQNKADIKANVEYKGQPYMVSEFGGAFWNADGDHLSNEWGYGTNPETAEAFYVRYEGLVKTLLENPDICGFCYTQLYDVFQEKNGLYTFDRRPKFDIDRIKKINSKKAIIED